MIIEGKIPGAGFDTIDCLTRLFDGIHTAAWRFLEVVQVLRSTVYTNFFYTPEYMFIVDLFLGRRVSCCRPERRANGIV